MSGFSAGGVAVDEREKWCQVSLSVPGAAVMAAVDAVAILDSGSGITTMSAGVANKLQAAIPGVQVMGGMAHPGKLKVADGRVIVVQERTCPVWIALHTSWGLVTMDPCSFAVMPRDDDVVILGNPTLKLLGTDAYDSWGRARGNVPPSPVSTPQRTGNAAASLLVSTLCSSSRAGRRRSWRRPRSAWWREGRTST